MRCVACGTEMLLVKVAPDNTMISSGYERYTLQCLGCFEIEEHLVFNGAKAAPTPSPSIAGRLEGLEVDESPQDGSRDAALPQAAEQLRTR
jgi:hypothetical protein